jgi:hypothetical protein
MLEVRPVEATEEALFEGSCIEFLPEPEGCEKGIFGAIGTLETVVHLLPSGAPERRMPWEALNMTLCVACMWCQLCSCPANHAPATSSLQAWQTEIIG